MKKNLFKSLLLISFVGLLSSCSSWYLGLLSSSSTQDFDSVSSGSNNISDDPHQGIQYEDLWERNGTLNFNSTGEARVLVIPVEFTDARCSALPSRCDGTKDLIERNFFGESSETGWESVSSFYQKSSYGKLNITGTVSDWYNIGISTSDLAAKRGYHDQTYYVLRNAISWYKENYSDITTYDQNQDGYIDGVWLVYAADFCGTNSTNSLCLDDTYGDVFWAYRYWDYEQRGNITSPVAYSYAWASYNFMYESSYISSKGPDAHTFIHETGHLLGLDDYYTYDQNSQYPAGGWDMMDLNVIDHMAYSKYLLKWVDPLIVNKQDTITLRPFVSSGDCVLIPSGSYTNSPFGEYLLLEYYAPIGLNEQDSSHQYYSGVTAYTNYGLRVYHVDARLATFLYSSIRGEYVPSNYFYNPRLPLNNTLIDFAHSNSISRSLNDNYLVRLIENGQTMNLLEGYVGSNLMLFYRGDDFGISQFTSYRFNDGSSVPVDFKITALGQNGVTIEFYNA